MVSTSFHALPTIRFPVADGRATAIVTIPRPTGTTRARGAAGTAPAVAGAPEASVAGGRLSVLAPSGTQRRLKLWIFVVFVGMLAALQLVPPLLFRHAHPAHGGFDRWVQDLAVLRLTPLAQAVLSLGGLWCFRSWHAKQPRIHAIDTEVSFRIVSRGQNADALRGTITNLQREMAALPLFPYRIEVVTDLDVDLPDAPEIVHLVVPADYRTPNGSRFKARALHYAIECSTLADDDWIMHLDEETRVTPSVIRGICAAVEQEEREGTRRIGQGAIMYHRDLDEHPFLTLADMMRTGDDFGRFYVQYRLGTPIFGMHGSFILVNNAVAKDVGFDFGPRGSITEDAFWALKQMENGRRVRWVDGYVVEQATQSVSDFLRQRRRWFVGLVAVVRWAPVSRRRRAVLGASVLLWGVSWTGIAYTLLQLFSGVEIDPTIALLGNVAFASYVMQYLVGLKVNLDERGERGAFRRLRLFALQIVLVPAFCVLEALGVLYALIRPETGFHVVTK